MVALAFPTWVWEEKTFKIEVHEEGNFSLDNVISRQSSVEPAILEYYQLQEDQ